MDEHLYFGILKMKGQNQPSIMLLTLHLHFDILMIFNKCLHTCYNSFFILPQEIMSFSEVKRMGQRTSI